MKNYKYFLFIKKFLCGVLLFTSATPSSFGAEFIIAHITDTHEFSEREDRPHVVGFSRTIEFVNKLRLKAQKENKRFLFVHSGDFLSPSPASKIFTGSDAIEILNASKLDFVALGNHDFDYGVEVLLERIKSSDFPVLCSNVIDTETGRPLEGLDPYQVAWVRGIRVAFVSAVTAKAQDIVDKFDSSIKIEDPVKSIRSAVDEIKKHDLADVIIALTHLENSEDQALAEAVPEINLILGGHKHEVYNEVINGVPISKVRNDGKDVNVVEFLYNPDTKEKPVIKIAPTEITKESPINHPMHYRIKKFDQQLDRTLREPLAYLDDEFNGTWKGMRDELKTTSPKIAEFIIGMLSRRLGVQFGILNLGAISKSDRMYGPGLFTLGDLQALFQFSDIIVPIEISGEDLRQSLEKMIEVAHDKESPSYMPILGSYIHNARLDIHWDLDKPKGARITQFNFDSKPILPEQLLRVAVNMFIYRNQEYMFSKGKLLQPLRVLKTDQDLISEALKSEFSIRRGFEKLEKKIEVLTSGISNLKQSCDELLHKVNYKSSTSQ